MPKFDQTYFSPWRSQYFVYFMVERIQKIIDCLNCLDSNPLNKIAAGQTTGHARYSPESRLEFKENYRCQKNSGAPNGSFR